MYFIAYLCLCTCSHAALRGVKAERDTGLVHEPSVYLEHATQWEEIPGVSRAVYDPLSPGWGKNTEVDVAIKTHVTGSEVTSFDIIVSLPGQHVRPRYFICSYLVQKQTKPVKMYKQDKDSEEYKKVEADDNLRRLLRTFVESDPTGHDDEYAAGTRMSCSGRVQVVDTSRHPEHVHRSVFDTSPTTPDDYDITALSLVVLDQDESRSTELYYEPENQKFYVTGGDDNQKLFLEQAQRREQSSANARRKLNFYKFKCRENKQLLNIKIGIVADKHFCKTAAAKGTENCMVAALAVVELVSKVIEKQLNVKMDMRSFDQVDWECDHSNDFMPTYKRMGAQRFASPQRAVYHFFTTCLAACGQHCGQVLGWANNDGIVLQEGRNIGVNRFRGADTFTFTHEFGHSLGFGHFFGLPDRDVHSAASTTSYGIMDYKRSKLLHDTAPYTAYNGVAQFTPRHEDGVRGSSTTDNVCRTIERAVQLLKAHPVAMGDKYVLEAPGEQAASAETSRPRDRTSTINHARVPVTMPPPPRVPVTRPAWRGSNPGKEIAHPPRTFNHNQWLAAFNHKQWFQARRYANSWYANSRAAGVRHYMPYHPSQPSVRGVAFMNQHSDF